MVEPIFYEILWSTYINQVGLQPHSPTLSFTYAVYIYVVVWERGVCLAWLIIITIMIVKNIKLHTFLLKCVSTTLEIWWWKNLKTLDEIYHPFWANNPTLWAQILPSMMPPCTRLSFSHINPQKWHYYNQTICPLLYKYIYKNHIVYRIKDVFPAIPGNAKDWCQI